MTQRDYTTTASDNTSIEGIALGDTMLANALDNAIRQAMADSAEMLLDLAAPTATTGTATAYVLATVGGVTSYADKLRLVVRPNVSNTGACTINVDTVGLKNIKVYGTGGVGDPTAGQIQAGGVYDLLYVSAIPAFVVMNPTLSLSADINGGTIDGTVIGGSTPAAGTFTTANTTGAATLASASVTGATTLQAVTATTIGATGLSTLASVDVNGGAIDGAVIGAASAQAITGTTVTASTGFVGGITGSVTGNTAGTHTGAVVGDVTGDVTGNVTAGSGSSTFNDVVINGGLNMDAATVGTITNLASPTDTGDAATKGYVDTSVSDLVASAPLALDTLNELAAALGDDANFSTTITNSIATKLPLAGGTMSGAIAMGTSKITGLGAPTAGADATTKTYADTQDALKLSLTGGTMSGAIAMGASKITGLDTPTLGGDATTKTYVDGILGSATSAATSAAAAETSATNSASSAAASLVSEDAAKVSEDAAAASYDSFDDRYLGAKATDPALDNDGGALLTGALYFNTTGNDMRSYSGSAWVTAYAPLDSLTLDGGTY